MPHVHWAIHLLISTFSFCRGLQFANLNELHREITLSNWGNSNPNPFVGTAERENDPKDIVMKKLYLLVYI